MPRREQFRPRDFANRSAQKEDRAGQMLGGVDCAIHVQDLLRARDMHVIHKLLAIVAKACAVTGAGKFRHPGAACAAVKVEAQLRPEAAQGRQFGKMNFGKIGVAFEDFPKTILNEDREAEVWTESFQNVERGCGEHAVAQAPQPEDGDPATPRQTF